MSTSKYSISHLPDEILGKILSFLPTKDAASTMILSKRWKNLLGHVDSLCFHEPMVEYANKEEALSGSHRFHEFVDKTLALLSNSQIKKLSLSMYGHRFDLLYVDQCLERWIKTAMKLGLLELHLHAIPRSFFSIEAELFTSNTLVKLTLSGRYSLENDRVFLPALKSLSLLLVHDDDDGYSSDDEPNAVMFGDITNLVVSISHITTLHLSPDSLEAFHFCCESMPIFNNLLKLSIDSNKDKGWQVMPLLLKRCPNLHTLVFKGLVHRVTNRCGDACACTPKKQSKIVKEESCCLWTCQVKVLKISEYGGSFQERNVLKHFLAKLEFLETVKVGVDADNSNYNSDFLRATLLILPKLSSKCNIQFI